MAETIEQLKAQFGQLSRPERAELAHFLLASLEPDDEGVAAAWEAEVARRVDEIHSGRAVGKPADQLFAELRLLDEVMFSRSGFMDFDDIRSMSVDDRIRLVQAIWDTIVADQAQPELTEAEKQELDRRIADLDANPGNVLTWEQIKAHVRGPR